MAGLYEPRALASALRDARVRTLGSYAHLDAAARAFPCIAIVNPPHWELAHIAWFQEHWCLRYDAAQRRVVRPSRLPSADALFDSSLVPHDSRWSLPYPASEVLRRYMEDTLEATCESLQGEGPQRRYFHELSLHHEDMHSEALLMTLQTLALPAPPAGWDRLEPPAVPDGGGDIAVAAGSFAQGAPRDADRFVFDNEKWAHEVHVPAFRIAARLVTMEEFAAFVDDGGYRRRPLWSDEGWRWREAADAEAPLDWRRHDGTWEVRRFDRWRRLEARAPMMRASFHECAAYCRWAGRRMPTEAEWERLAQDEGQAMEAGQLYGSVWQWTSTPFRPYPGFEADPYEDYSRPWFETHHVVRGGSFATRARLCRPAYRNFYQPHRRDMFVGLRTCALES